MFKICIHAYLNVVVVMGKVKVVMTVNFTCFYALKSFNGGVHLSIVLNYKHRRTTIFVIIMYETYYELFVSRIFFSI